MSVWQASVILFYVAYTPSGAVEMREVLPSMDACATRSEEIKREKNGLTSDHKCFDLAKRYDTSKRYWSGPMYLRQPYYQRK